MSYVNINGKITSISEASVPHDNRALRYGYGLFETMLVKQGTIELWHYHADRLFDGMRQLAFDVPALFKQDWLHAEVLKTAVKNQLEKLCRVRLQVYAGNGGLFDGDTKPGYIIECFSLDERITELNETGLVTGIATELYKSTDSLANLKTTNALIYATAARQAKASKWNDALILNTSGNIIESTIANIFSIKDDEIYTPPLAEGCIAGIMRRHLLEQLPKHGFNVYEHPFTEGHLQNADAVFLTNAIRRIKWIRTIADTEYTTGIIPSIYSVIFK